MAKTSRPPMLLAAAAALAAEAVALLAYTVITVIDIAEGQAYTFASGAGQVVLQAIMIAGVVSLAAGVVKMKPWTRTPSVMVQVLVGFVGVVLVQAHRYAWGVPALLLALAGLVGLLTPASRRALSRPL